MEPIGLGFRDALAWRRYLERQFDTWRRFLIMLSVYTAFWVMVGFLIGRVI